METVKERILDFLTKCLIKQFPNEMTAHIHKVKDIVRGCCRQGDFERQIKVMETLVEMGLTYGAGMADIINEMYFQGEAIHENLVNIAKILIRKTDRTVIDLTDTRTRANI